jgi:CubicO group peptidase (beta-lactamase class C family)
MKKFLTISFLTLAIAVCGGQTSLAQNPIFKPPTQPIKTPSDTLSREAEKAVLLKKFADRLQLKLANKSVGYAFVASFGDGLYSEARAAGDARRQPDALPRKITADDNFNLASVSKTITAAALLKLLDQKKISVDAKIYSYLPPFWSVPESIKTITFRELLTHTSGLRCAKEVTDDNLRECLQAGIKLEDKQKDCDGNANPNGCYTNSNYGLFRILIPSVNGYKPQLTMDAKLMSEAYAREYIDYVRKNIFEPIGLPKLYCKPNVAQPALAYQFPSPLASGDDFGDKTEICGSQGWNLSARQLSIFAANLFFTNRILPLQVREQMKKEHLGFRFYGTLTGDVKIYGHGGYYPGKKKDGTLYNKGEMNTLIMGYSNGISLALIINSQYTGEGGLAGTANLTLREILENP